MSHELSLSGQLEFPSLTIIIDAWNFESYSNSTQYTTVINYITDFCINNHWVEAVALSTYGSDGENTVSNDKEWLSQGKQFFQEEVRWQYLKKIWDLQNITINSITHDKIADLPLRKNQIRFAAFNALQILWYCNNVNPGIKNIYFCGNEWDLCIKTRPIGWLEMVALINANMFTNTPNILVHTDCVFSRRTDDIRPDPRIWQQLDDKVYQLETQSSWIYQKLNNM